MRYVIIDPTDGVVNSPSSPGSVDNQVTVTIRALDQYGNIATAENRDVTLRVSGHAVAPNSGVVNIGSGVGTIQITNTRPETVNLSLLDSSNTGVDVTSTQSVVVVAGLLVLFEIWAHYLTPNTP